MSIRSRRAAPAPTPASSRKPPRAVAARTSTAVVPAARAPTEAFDLLTDVMDQVRLEGTVYFDAELHAPYGIAIDRPHRSPFYVGIDGECEILVGRRVFTLAAHDFVLLPGAAPHVVRSDAKAAVMPFDDWVATHTMDARGRVVHPGPGAARRVIGGFFSTDALRGHPLFSALPAIIVLRGDEPAVQRWLAPTVAFIRAEIESGPHGSRTVLRRMADVLFIQAVRAYAEQNACAAGWLRGLADLRVGRALALLHAQYTRDWTLDALAREVGASRTGLAVQFRNVVGESPMAYLTRWRITRAANRLRSERTPLARIAADVGYASDAVFSKAFRRVTGMPPARFRRESFVPQMPALSVADQA